MINPLKEVEVNGFILRHPRVNASLKGMRIAQVTDPHMGRWVKARHLRQLVEFVNEREPAVVALTGDYVGYSKLDLDSCVEALSHFDAPTYAVLGNHDHWASTEWSHRAFEKTGIRLLTNENELLDWNGTKINIVGVDDAVTGHADVPKAFEGIEPDFFRLTLNHVPSIAWECADAGADLILSGHTHGFQFNIPRVTNALAERFGTQLFAGPYRLGGSMLYISRGLGSASWPWRIRARPELSFFELQPGEFPELEWVEGSVMKVRHRT